VKAGLAAALVKVGLAAALVKAGLAAAAAPSYALSRILNLPLKKL